MNELNESDIALRSNVPCDGQRVTAIQNWSAIYFVVDHAEA